MRKNMLLKSMKMAADMKEKKNKGGETGKENFTIKKEASMTVSGKIIICMAMENFTIQIKN